jgi:hypothetical protein
MSWHARRQCHSPFIAFSWWCHLCNAGDSSRCVEHRRGATTASWSPSQRDVGLGEVLHVFAQRFSSLTCRCALSLHARRSRLRVVTAIRRLRTHVVAHAVSALSPAVHGGAAASVAHALGNCFTGSNSVFDASRRTGVLTPERRRVGRPR